MQNVTDTLENNLMAFYKIKHPLTIKTRKLAFTIGFYIEN